MIKYCRTCRILDPVQHVCQLNGMRVDPNEDFCSRHATTLETCDVCGKPVIKPILTPDGTSWKKLCGDCAEQLNTCGFCRMADTCSFESDPSPLPKMVQRRIQQGPMTSITTVQNPDRVAITCAKGCACYDAEQGCMRQFHCCNKLEHIYAEEASPDAAEDPQSAKEE